jgi:hypothetical protein
MGGILLHGKTRHPVGLSLAGLRPLVLMGGFLPPGGSERDGFTESSGLLPTLFDTQVAEQSNEHQTTLRLAARFDGEASPVPVRKSPCFEARSAS